MRFLTTLVLTTAFGMAAAVGDPDPILGIWKLDIVHRRCSDYDAIGGGRIDARLALRCRPGSEVRLAEITLQHADKVIAKAEGVVSGDGKTMTPTYEKSEADPPVKNVSVYEKQ